MFKKNETLLIVDDSPEHLLMLGHVVGDFFTNVLSAANGREALKILAQQKVDIVITDWDMPYLSGSEFITALRTMYPLMPIVVLSGNLELEEKKMFEYGIAGFARKPYRLRELEAILIKISSMWRGSP